MRGLIPKRFIIPYHGYILIQTTDEGLSIRYTNNEASFKTILDDGFEGEFNLCIDATLIEALADVDSMLTFKVEDNRCTVTTKGRRFKLPVLDAENYPLDIASNEKIFDANSAEIRTAIDKCNGVGLAEGPGYLIGNRFTYDGSTVEVGASDSVAMMYCSIQGKAVKEFGFAVRNYLCLIIKKMCEKDEIISVYESDKDVKWVCGNSTLTTRKFNTSVLKPFSGMGEQIKEKASDKIKVVDRKWLIDTLTRSTLFADAVHSNITIYLKENEITLSVSSDKGLSSEQTVDCLYEKSGDATEIILNYNILIKLLGKLDDEDVVLGIAPDGTPVSVPLFVNEGDVNFLLHAYIY
jgi:DNA polymerase III sliding clamp (beta) subunit (PCNA family)